MKASTADSNEHSANWIFTAVDSWMVYGWNDIQEASRDLRGTDASDKVKADLVVETPHVLLDMVSRRELIVARIPPPLPEVTPEDLAVNDGSIMGVSGAAASPDLAKLPPLRRPVWVGHGQYVYDVTGK